MPSRPVEVLIAASVGVAAVHAVRPLAARGAAVIALGFGLVHGLAFAGILADLGLDGTTSVLSLLAFNVGIELAQLATVALVLPSLYVLSRTRAYPAVRTAAAGLALAAATGWGLDRLGLAGQPARGRRGRRDRASPCRRPRSRRNRGRRVADGRRAREDPDCFDRLRPMNGAPSPITGKFGVMR